MFMFLCAPESVRITTEGRPTGIRIHREFASTCSHRFWRCAWIVTPDMTTETPFFVPRVHSSLTAFSANVLFTCLRVCLFFVCCRHICKVFLYILMMPNSPSPFIVRHAHTQPAPSSKTMMVTAAENHCHRRLCAPRYRREMKWETRSVCVCLCVWWRTEQETGRICEFPSHTHRRERKVN